MKLQQLRKQAKIGQSELAYMIGADAPALSRIEKGHVLPTVNQLRWICKNLNCNPLDIYTRAEIDLINCMGKPDRVRPTVIRKVQFRRNELAAKVLDPDTLKQHGYVSAQEWFDTQIENTGKRWKL